MNVSLQGSNGLREIVGLGGAMGLRLIRTGDRSRGKGHRASGLSLISTNSTERADKGKRKLSSLLGQIEWF